MDALKEKIDLLEKEGFTYIFDRDLYCSIRDRKCFSLEFLEDNTWNIISKKLSERPKDKIVFYFNQPPSRTLRSEIEKMFGLSNHERKVSKQAFAHAKSKTR